MGPSVRVLYAEGTALCKAATTDIRGFEKPRMSLSRAVPGLQREDAILIHARGAGKLDVKRAIRARPNQD